MKKESKFLLNMPDVLYGLQVNEDFTDVEIKEIKLLPYPKLEDLTRFIDESSNLPTGADLRKLGMSELVDVFSCKFTDEGTYTYFWNRWCRNKIKISFYTR